MSEQNQHLEAAGAAMDSLFILMKTLVTYGDEHPSSTRSAEAAAWAIEAAEPPFSLQFVGGGAFRDRALIPLTVQRFLRLRGVSAALENLGVHEISFKEGIGTDELLRFGAGLAAARNARGKHLDAAQLTNVEWRAIANAAWGADGVEVDPETFVLAQIALAILDAEQVADSDPSVWPWSRAFNVIRRLEQALAEDPQSAARALEGAPGRWTPARRAVSAALTVMSVLAGLDVDSPVRRSTGHAMLALALQGYDVQRDAGLLEAADQLFRRLVNTTFSSRSGVEPHRLRVCAVIHQLANAEEGERDSWMLAMQIIHVGYEMERQRCPADVEFALSKTDCLAALVRAGAGVHPDALRLVLGVLGTAPAQAAVG